MVLLKRINWPGLAAFALLMLFAGWAGLVHATQAGQGNSPSQISPSLLQKLTAEELAWLHTHPVIRVVQDPGWSPVEFADEKGEFAGMAGDYLKIIEQRLGVRFERVKGLSWQEAYARLKRREIDMTTSVAVTPERSQFWAFTKPYMKIPIVIVTRTEITYIADMRELAGKKVAIVDGYAVNDWIPRDFPDIQLVRFPTAQECLKALSRGDVFAYIDNMLVIGYYMAKLKMTMLKIAGETPYVNAQSMAVRKDWAPLAGILQKALDSISETEHNDIYRKWLPVRYEHGFDYTLLWYALAIFAVIFLGMAVWNWKLLKEISSRKKAEIALQNSEEKFRLVFESANVGKSITLPSGEINVNKAYCDMLGYTPDELRNKRWQDITPPEDIEATQAHLDLLLQGNRDSIRFYKRYLHKSGSYVWVDISLVIQRDQKHKPLFFITTIVDITERKIAEENMRLAYDRLRRFMDSNIIGMIIANADGRVLEANDYYLNLTGFTRADFQAGKVDWRTITPAEWLPADEEAIAALREHGASVSYEKEYVRNDGTRVPIFIAITTLPGPGEPIAAFMLDITDRKQKEQELLEKEVQYRNLANAGLALIWTSGLDKLCTYFNEPWLKFTGRTLEQEWGNGWTEGVHPDDLERCVNIYVSAFDQRQSFEMEYRLRHASGEYRWIKDMGTPNFSAGGEFVGYIGHCFDITESKRDQEEIRKLNDELEQKVQERTVELQQIIAQLEETNKIFVGRELKMVELKKRIAELEGKA